MKKIIIFIITVHCSLFSVHWTTAQHTTGPTVVRPVFSGKTKAIRETRVVLPGPLNNMGEVAANPLQEIEYDESQITEDRLVLEGSQDTHGASSGISTLLNFEGMDNILGGWPADPNGDISKEYYVQTINSCLAVYDKSGNILYGPIAYKSIFESFPGPWNEIHWCDPVILYDHLADRWVFTTMSLDLDQRIYYEMNAVSVSPDPMGEYYCYAYEFEHVNDYPKMSIWPNGYYITYNIFTPNWQYEHPLVTVVDRQAMLNGEPDVVMVQFALDPFTPALWPQSIMSADLNGAMMPVSEACPILVPECDFIAYPWDIMINMYGLLPDWQNPGNSTLDSICQFQADPTFPFINAKAAPQPGNFHDVETVIFYLMYPLHYRNFGTHESMVTCHTLFDGEVHYLRWYEFRKDTGNWHVHQSGNYIPDSLSRYMPSLSMNGNGDMAMGFTKSGLEKNPSIWLTGRKASDPPGIMSFQEIELYQGMNYVNNYSSSNNRNRWGDYAAMMVDPENDTTFWFTSMYPVEADNPGNWSTRIFAFNLNDMNNDPVAYAGADTVICMDDMFFTKGIADNFSALLWCTDGDGNFTSEHSLKTGYIRGNQDLEHGQVKLHLSLDGHVPGTTDSDTMILYINKYPEVEAGEDDTVCCNHSFSLQGQVSFSEAYYWTSNGSGTFNDNTLLDAIYTPALCDTSMDHVTLTLHAEPLEPCADMRSDSVFLCVKSCLGLEEYNGSIVNIQTYPNPVREDMHLQALFREDLEVIVQVINNSGKAIFKGIYPTVNKKITKAFDFSHMPDGVYFIRLRAGEASALKKVIVSH